MVAARLQRQSLPMLAAVALLLPAIIALAVWLNAQLDAQRHDVERQALFAAQEIVALADAEAHADQRQLTVIANAPSARENNLDRLTQFFDLALANNPTWRGLVVREAATGRVLLLEEGRGDARQPLLPLPRALPGGLGTENVFPTGRYCPCVVLHTRMAGDPARVLTLYLDPRVFQDIVERFPNARGVSGLATRDGRCLGRSLAFDTRVGRQGSTYLQQAAARGGSGFYYARTLEGLPSYTAHATSALTGWSGHVAVESDAIDNPRTWANASVAAAIIAALILAFGLLAYAAYEMRRRRGEEARLVGMQKAEAISLFTGTMAHDFRNILSVIDAGVRLILRHTQEETTTKRGGAIGDAVERGKRLVNQLLSFVRGDGAEVETLDLAKCIGGADELLAGSLGEGIEFRWHVDEDARHAFANADQFELALLNLAINARDAMDGHGSFTLAVTRDGEWAAISACDSGPGIPPELRERIFEAFFSTKGDGKGSGLGLAQVAGAARQAGGRVELTGNTGGGACFTIYLRRADVAGQVS